MHTTRIEPSSSSTSYYSAYSSLSSSRASSTCDEEEELEELEEEPHIIQTLDAIDWDVLLARASRLRHLDQLNDTPPPRLGDYLVGGYNIVRFIHFDDGVEWVARFPQLPEHPVSNPASSGDVTAPYRSDWDQETFGALSRKLHNEVATMHYIQHHTSIPVPVVFDYNFDRTAGGVGIPYMLMSRVEGQPLCDVWEDMSDDDRKEIMREVANMLLELSEHRFERIGSLKLEESDCDGADSVPVVRPPHPLPTPPSTPSHSPACSCPKSKTPSAPIAQPHTIPETYSYRIDPPVDQPCTPHLTIPLNRTFNNAADYWKTYATAELDSLLDVRFGDPRKADQYAAMWFARELVPKLYPGESGQDESSEGFPIYPHDLYAQNIMITYDTPFSYSTTSLVSALDIDSPASSESSSSSSSCCSSSTSASSVQKRRPRITGLIDWEFACTAPLTTFAQYPCFLLDDPRWPSVTDDDETHPLRTRNEKDRQTFLELLQEAERALDPDTPLSQSLADSTGVTLFERVVQFDRWRETLIAEMLQHLVIGQYPGADDITSARAMLRKKLPPGLVERFEKEQVMMEELRSLAPWIGLRLISRKAVTMVVDANIAQMSGLEGLKAHLSALETSEGR